MLNFRVVWWASVKEVWRGLVESKAEQEEEEKEEEEEGEIGRRRKRRRMVK